MSVGRIPRVTGPDLAAATRVFAPMALALTIVSACAPGLDPQPRPARELVAVVLSTPGCESLQARGNLTISSPEGVFRGAVLMHYRYPDSLRVVVQIGLGSTVADIAMTGADGIAYLPQHRQALMLDAGSAIGLGSASVHPSLLMTLFRPAQASDMIDTRVAVPENGAYVLRNESVVGVRTWRVSAELDLISEHFVDAQQTLAWHREFATRRGLRVPSAVSLSLGPTQTSVTLTRIDGSPRWERSPFHVRLPEGMEPVPLVPLR